jgi:SAM-dependent methyltransferase
MTQDVYHELHNNIIKERPGRLDYVEKAFKMLPKIDKPNILDIGCGAGEPTIELAKLSDGFVTGIDIDQKALDKFESKVDEQNLSDKIKILNKSLFDLDFPEESYDIIWSEGSIYVIGFKQGLSEWRRFIKPGGFMVINDMCWIELNPPKEIREHWEKMYPGITTIENLLEIIPACGFSYNDHFAFPEDAWGEIYFDPLEERIENLREKFKMDPGALATLEKEFQEVELYRKYKKWYGSAYFIIQKK